MNSPPFRDTDPSTTSSLPFDPACLTQGIRVKPAQFARMCKVSKQAVSQWIKAGKITLFPDGTLDPARAAKQVIDNSDPARLRAKLFRVAVDDVGALRQRVHQLEDTLAQATERLQFAEYCLDEMGEFEEIFVDLLIKHAAELRGADDSAYKGIIDRLRDEASIEAGERVGAYPGL